MTSYFQETYTRLEDGRYEVRLPWRDDAPPLGASRKIAIQRHHSSEKSLKRQGRWQEFNTAVEDFITQGHAELVPDHCLNKPDHLSYYMPMHGVVKKTSTSTKLRPVCDASAKTMSGASLNEALLTGPSLYLPLTTIVNRFRLSKVALTSDVAQMYRQISLSKEDRDYHRFLHCDSRGETRDYRMTRVTFGVKSSPCLASQVLQQIIADHGPEHPRVAKKAKISFYVDDLLTGAETVEEAQVDREELCKLFSKGHFPLRKWRSNSQQVLESIPEELRETSDLHIVTATSEYQKTLGLHWGTAEDCLYAAAPKLVAGDKLTKRILTSSVSKIFDPLGWFSPALIPARVMIQEAWKLHLGWDDPLPEHFNPPWKLWASTISSIRNHPIPRFIGLSDKVVMSRQLHGFADASQAAYGGVAYV